MKRGAIESPKILDLGDWLADRLDLPTGLAKTLAVGLMEKVWQHTARQAPAGDLGKMSNRRIADAVDWPHAPNELIAVLVRLRLLDEHPVYRLLVHDWDRHADGYADRYLADNGMLYACGASPRHKPRTGSPAKLGKTGKPMPPPPPDSHPHAGDSQASAFSYSDSESDSGPEPDHRTLSSASADAAAAPDGAELAMGGDESSGSATVRQAAGAKPVMPARKPSNRRREYTQAFEAAWAAYGKRGTKLAAAKAYRDAISYISGRDGEPTGDPHEWMLGRVTLWAEINAGKDRRYWKHLERWLRDGGFDFDEGAERAASPEDREAREKREREQRVREAMKERA